MAARDRRRRGRAARAAEAPVYRASETSYEPVDGEMVTLRRLHDTIKALARCRTRPLSWAEQRAGRRFQDSYEQAQADQPRALDPEQPGGGKGTTPQGPADSILAGVQGRRELERALIALGGAFVPGAQVALAVLGEGRTLRQAGEAFGLGNGRNAESAAKWLLIAALGVLAAHYGLAGTAGLRRRRGKEVRRD